MDTQALATALGTAAISASAALGGIYLANRGRATADTRAWTRDRKATAYAVLLERAQRLLFYFENNLPRVDKDGDDRWLINQRAHAAELAAVDLYGTSGVRAAAVEVKTKVDKITPVGPPVPREDVEEFSKLVEALRESLASDLHQGAL